MSDTTHRAEVVSLESFFFDLLWPSTESYPQKNKEKKTYQCIIFCIELPEGSCPNITGSLNFTISNSFYSIIQENPNLVLLRSVVSHPIKSPITFSQRFGSTVHTVGKSILSRWILSNKLEMKSYFFSILSSPERSL